MMTWFPQPIGELDGPRLRRYADRCGAEGLGVWFAAKCEMYRAAADGTVLGLDELSRAVSRDCGIGRKKAENLLRTAAECGVFRIKMDEKSSCEGYGFQEEVDRYANVSKQRKQAAKRRWWNENA